MQQNVYLDMIGSYYSYFNKNPEISSYAKNVFLINDLVRTFINTKMLSFINKNFKDTKILIGTRITTSTDLRIFESIEVLKLVLK